MKQHKEFQYLDKVLLLLRPSLVDPCHINLFSIPVRDEVASGLTTVAQTKWIGCSGTKLIYWTMGFLAWLIKRHLGKYPLDVIQKGCV